MSSSSSVQCLYNSISTGRLKQARGCSGKETKLHQVTQWRKKTGSVWGPVLLWLMNENNCVIYDSGSQVKTQVRLESVAFKFPFACKLNSSCRLGFAIKMLIISL